MIRKITNVILVAKVLAQDEALKNTKIFILEKNLSNVNFVQLPLQVEETRKCIKEFILVTIVNLKNDWRFSYLIQIIFATNKLHEKELIVWWSNYYFDRLGIKNFNIGLVAWKLFVLLSCKRINKINDNNFERNFARNCVKNPSLECSKAKQASNSFTVLFLDCQLSK